MDNTKNAMSTKDCLKIQETVLSNRADSAKNRAIKEAEEIYYI
jgi:hypothetical protein